MRVSNRILVFIVAILTFASTLAYWLLFKSASQIEIPESLHQATVDFSELNQKVYIMARAWGLGGNHEEIVFSTSPINKERLAVNVGDIIFYAPEVYYKKQGLDTLVVFAESASIASYPDNDERKIKFILIPLNNYNEVTDYERNYLKYGLDRISVYND